MTARKSVRWIIEHPLPIFLCVVQKAKARILVYHTTPRFAAWILPLHKTRLELIPGTERRAQSVVTSWEQGSSFELKAPILNFTIQEALTDSFRAGSRLCSNSGSTMTMRISFGSNAETLIFKHRTHTKRTQQIHRWNSRVWRPIFRTICAARGSGARRVTRTYRDASL